MWSLVEAKFKINSNGTSLVPDYGTTTSKVEKLHHFTLHLGISLEVTRCSYVFVVFLYRWSHKAILFDCGTFEFSLSVALLDVASLEAGHKAHRGVPRRKSRIGECSVDWVLCCCFLWWEGDGYINHICMYIHVYMYAYALSWRSWKTKDDGKLFNLDFLLTKTQITKQTVFSGERTILACHVRNRSVLDRSCALVG